MDWLQEHLTTVVFLLFAVGAVIALANKSIDFPQFAVALGVGGGGIGGMGVARSIRQNGRNR